MPSAAALSAQVLVTIPHGCAHLASRNLGFGSYRETSLRVYTRAEQGRVPLFFACAFLIE